MAMIHHQLYATDIADRLDFTEYVENLVRNFSTAFATDDGRMTLGVDADAVEMHLDLAIPCGLILNELLTNALRHAFPDNRRGSIHVRLKRLDSGSICLSCEDDGVGIPKDFDWQNARSLGLTIARTLARQIDGSLALDGDRTGTRFMLTVRTEARDSR